MSDRTNSLRKLFVEADIVEYDDPGDYLGGMSPEDLEALRKSNEFEVQYNRSKAPDLGGADVKPYRDRRGFIDPEGKIIEIGGMGHDQSVHEMGYTGFRRLDDFYKATGWVRWSPETDAFSGGLTLTDAQIRTIKDILAEYGFYGLVFELITKNGGKQVVGFNDHGSVDAKIAKIQNLINDKKVDKKKKIDEFRDKIRSQLGL
jgi:hypothetical protein